LAGEPQPFLRAAPPAVEPRLRMPSSLSQPPGFHWSYGARLVILRPNLRMAPGRRGAVFSLHATF
jgi:hypothetical protein